MFPRASALISGRSISASVACAVLLFSAPLAWPSAARGDAAPTPEALMPLRGHGKVRVETLDGRLVQGAPLGVLGDSLILRRHTSLFMREEVRIARADIARVWGDEHHPRTMARVYGAAGFAGGALLELGLGSSRKGLGFDPVNVLGGAVMIGAASAVAGALNGLTSSTWVQIVPPPGDDPVAAAPLFPPWSATFTGGVDRASEFIGTGSQVNATLAVWTNTSRHVSSGVEFGTLSRESKSVHRDAIVDTSYSGIYYFPAVDEELESRWAYTALQSRVRIGRHPVQPLLAFGPAWYMNSFPHSETLTGLNGSQTYVHRRNVWGRLGANAGVGVTWGRGPMRPDIEARLHWAGSSSLYWFTLQAGAVYF